MSDLNFKYVGDGVDQVCKDLEGHTNSAWGDPWTKDIDSIIIIYKEPSEDEENDD